MRCDICNQEFANSEEVKAHKEEAHPLGDDKDKPEMNDGIQMGQGETPEPGELLNR